MYWTPYGNRLFLFINWLFSASVTSSFFYFSAVKTDNTHKGLTWKYNSIHMPEELQTCYKVHHVYKDDTHEWYLTVSRFCLWFKLDEQSSKTQKIKKIEELIKQSGFAKTIHFQDIFTLGKLFCKACLPGLCWQCARQTGLRYYLMPPVSCSCNYSYQTIEIMSNHIWWQLTEITLKSCFKYDGFNGFYDVGARGGYFIAQRAIKQAVTVVIMPILKDLKKRPKSVKFSFWKYFLLFFKILREK